MSILKTFQKFRIFERLKGYGFFAIVRAMKRIQAGFMKKLLEIAILGGFFIKKLKKNKKRLDKWGKFMYLNGVKWGKRVYLGVNLMP